VDEPKQFNLVTPAPLCFNPDRSSVLSGRKNTSLQFTHRRCSAGHQQSDSQQGITLRHELLTLQNRAVLIGTLHGRRKSQRPSQLVITASRVARSTHSA
jgi:hypothetical protein